MCPNCGSFERTRLFSLYLDHIELFDTRPRMLHFAPERKLTERLRSALGSRYVTTDLMMEGVDEKEDITAMTFEDGRFDFVFCSHVLEHIVEDAVAMGELFRVLSPGGEALIQVPMKGEITYENPSIIDPVERVKHFGQFDHVRYYGSDIAQRLEHAGFEVTPIKLDDFLQLNEDEQKRMNIGNQMVMFKCIKPAA